MVIIFTCFWIGGETKGQIGVPETMITSAVSGLLYALFAGQPLIITGNKIFFFYPF